MIREILSRSRFALGGAILFAPLAATSQAQLASLTEQKVSSTQGGFPAATLEAGDQFGISVAAVGDLDGDTIGDLAVGAIGDDDGGTSSFFTGRGAVYILFQNADGTVKGTQKISATSGGLSGMLEDFDDFGSALAGLGDLDGDGVEDIAVGARGADDGASGAGAVFVLFLNANGTVKAEQKISALEGGFGGTLAGGDGFGSSLAYLGDVDGDGVGDLAVGAPGDDDGASGAGAVWVLFMNTNGTVDSEQKISATSGSLIGTLAGGDAFGGGLGALGDFNGDTVPDVAVGATGDDDGGADRGAVYVLFLTSGGTVTGGAHIGSSDFAGLNDGDAFGTSIAMGDVTGDSALEVLVGAPRSDAGGNDRGAVWALGVDSSGAVTSSSVMDSVSGGFSGTLDDDDLFGRSLASLGNQDGLATEDFFVGAHLDDDGGSASGAAWTVFTGAASSSIVRNGSGSNPLSFAETSPSILGQNWETTVDIVTPGAFGSIVVIGAAPTSGTFLSGMFSGELLIQPTFFLIDPAFGTHSVPVPNDIGLLGTQLYTQGVTYAVGDIRLTNALDIVLGSS